MQEMSVIKDYYPGVDDKLSKEETDVLNEGLDSILQKGEKSPITKNKRKTKKTLEYVTYLLNDFYKNPKKFDNLKNYLRTNGLYLREPTQVGVFDDTPYAVARTDTQNIVEVNLNFDKLVNNMMNQYSLKRDEAEELVLTHELVHMAQPSKILNAQPQPYIAELHVELVLRDYFMNKSINSNNQKESKKYSRMSKAAEKRATEYTNLFKQMKNYISMN